MDCETCLFFQEAARGQNVEQLKEVIRYQREKYGQYMQVTAENLTDILTGAGIHPSTIDRVINHFNKSSWATESEEVIEIELGGSAEAYQRETL